MVADTKFLDSTLWPYIVPQGWSPAWEPFVAIGAYFSMILLAKVWIMIRKKPYQLTLVLKIHNVILATISAVMFAGLGWSVIRAFMSSGLYGTFCHSDDENDANIFWWMQIYYLSKWPEFLDTVFLVLRGRYVDFPSSSSSNPILILIFHRFILHTMKPVDILACVAPLLRGLGHLDG